MQINGLVVLYYGEQWSLMGSYLKQNGLHEVLGIPKKREEIRGLSCPTGRNSCEILGTN